MLQASATILTIITGAVLLIAQRYFIPDVLVTEIEKDDYLLGHTSAGKETFRLVAKTASDRDYE